MSNLEKYNNVFMTVFAVEESQLNGDFKQKNIANWDSVTHLSLITTLEERFDIMFDTEDILGFASYDQGKEIMIKFEIQI